MPCFTPVRSPESNGMAEAFVKTLKRDYARIQPRPAPLTVLQHLPAWIEDHNESHPHSGSQMRSPREFIQTGRTARAPCAPRWFDLGARPRAYVLPEARAARGHGSG